MFCPKCGNELEWDAAFCGECGAKVMHYEDYRETDVEPEDEYENLYEEAYEEEDEEAWTPPIRNAQPTPKKSIAPVVIGIVAALAAVIVGGVIFLKGGKDTAEEPKATVAEQTEVKEETAKEQQEEAIEQPEETENDNSATVTVEAPAASTNMVRDVVSSSYLYETQYNKGHYATNVIDGTMEHAWSEGVDGDGIGESITLQMNGACRVSGFDIYAGYQKSSNAYYKNNRPAKIRIMFDQGGSIEVDLADQMGKQTVTFASPVETTLIGIEILDVYPGTDYHDTCISEISLF